MKSENFYARPEQMRQCTLQNIHFTDRTEYAAAEISDETFDMLLQLQLDGTRVQVLGVDCEVDGQFAHDYHSVRLPNGEVLDAFSGYNLKPCSV